VSLRWPRRIRAESAKLDKALKANPRGLGYDWLSVLNHCGCNTMYFANAWLAPKKDLAILVCANLGLDAFQPTDEAVAELVHYAETLKHSSP
jgi:hypothetical protein